MIHQYSYLLGSRHACVKLGMDETQAPQPEGPPTEEEEEEEAVPGTEGELSEEQLAALLATQESGAAGSMPGEEQLMEAGAEGEQQIPEELLQALLAGEGMEGGMPGEEGQAPTADMFVDFAHSDDTAGEADPNMMPVEEQGKQDPTTWSGAASMEGGDAATRGQEMGLPKFNGV